MCNKENIIKKYNLNVIPMASFLYNFCAICDHNVFKVTHYDIKRLFPYLKTCSIEYVCKNYDLVCDGSVILVKDAKNNILPYAIPPFLNQKFKNISDILAARYTLCIA